MILPSIVSHFRTEALTEKNFVCPTVRMSHKSDDLDEEFFYDFRKARKWYKRFTGTSLQEQTESTLYFKTYRIFAISFLTTMQTMFLVTALLTTDYLVEFAEAFHYGIILSSMVMFFPIEGLAKKDINKTFQELKKCFYSYNGILNAEQKEMKQKIIKDIKFVNNLFFWMLIFVCILYSILTPLKDYFYPHLKLKRSEIINKKLPIPFYIPFEDSYGIAFCIVFLMECCCNIMVHSLITSIHEAYISLTGQIYGELKLLNYSIRHSDERAIKIYFRLKSKVYHPGNLYQSSIFQDCLKECLKEDLIHHQTLLRCIELVRPFTGRVIISVFTLCSVAWAVGIYFISKLLEQGNGLDKVLEFCIMLFTECVYVFDMCLFNEKIKSEVCQSDELYELIYSTSWYNCDKAFGNNIRIMLMSTRNPPQLNANLFNMSASFETFLPLLTAAFSYFNVLRNINK